MELHNCCVPELSCFIPNGVTETWLSNAPLVSYLIYATGTNVLFITVGSVP